MFCPIGLQRTKYRRSKQTLEEAYCLVFLAASSHCSRVVATCKARCFSLQHERFVTVRILAQKKRAVKENASDSVREEICSTSPIILVAERNSSTVGHWPLVAFQMANRNWLYTNLIDR